MVKKLVLYLSLLAVCAWSSTYARVSSTSPEQIHASQIKRGCVLQFDKRYLHEEVNSLGSPSYNLALSWLCTDEKIRKIDEYDVEGGDPEIATVIVINQKGFAVLVKWSINSQASDFNGDFYKVYVYKYDPVNHLVPFIRQDRTMEKFGQGWDGVRNGNIVRYQFKDAASIRRRLHQLNGW